MDRETRIWLFVLVTTFIVTFGISEAYAQEASPPAPVPPAAQAGEPAKVNDADHPQNAPANPAVAPADESKSDITSPKQKQSDESQAMFTLLRRFFNDPNFRNSLFTFSGGNIARENGRQDKELSHLKSAINATRNLSDTVREERSFFKGELSFWWCVKSPSNSEILAWRDTLQQTSIQLEDAIADDASAMRSYLYEHTILFSLRLDDAEDIVIPRMPEIKETDPVLDHTALCECAYFTERLHVLQYQRHVCREQFFVALSRYLSVKCVALEDKLREQQHPEAQTKKEETTAPALFPPVKDGK